MTTYIRYGVNCIRIPRHAIPRALLKLNLLWREEKDKIISSYAYVAEPQNDTFTTLREAFAVFGFFSGKLSTYFVTDDGDVILSGFESKRLEYEEIILRELATCMDDCSVEVITEDDGILWEWNIQNGQFYKFTEPCDFVINMAALKIGDDSVDDGRHTPDLP
jgi:hypothetical protein